MLSRVKRTILAAVLAAVPLFAEAQAESVATGQASCQGSFFNPVSDVDWNNMLPVTIGFVKYNNGNTTPLLQYEPALCVCPGPMGAPSPGTGVTYFEPVFLAEIERSPGCMSSLGGTKILKGFDSLHSEQISKVNGDGQVSRMQLHWYEYPIFAGMEFMSDLVCKSAQGVSLVNMTEIDPFWQSDAWAAVFSPDAGLFANLIAQTSCAVDAIASTAHYPIDSLIWCAGTWGSVYPFSGNPGHTNSNFTSNNLILAKYIARESRLGKMFQTIGPSAMCFAHPSPVWIKSQYRYNQVAPIARRGSTVETGNPGVLLWPPVTNLPTKESTVDLVWRARQCCARLY